VTKYGLMDKNFVEKNQEMNADISVKQKEIQVELDAEKLGRLKRELEVLNLRKKVIDLNGRIDQLRSL
jgi:hypothetical protein